MASNLREFAEYKKWKFTNEVLYGEESGYLFTLVQRKSFKYIVLPLASITEEQKIALQEYLNENMKTLNLAHIRFDNSVIIIRTKEPVTGLKVEEIDAIIKALINHLKDNKISQEKNCIVCGEKGSNETCTIDGIKYYVHNTCLDKEVETLNKQKEAYLTEKKNYLTGTIGAIIGGMVATIPWIALSYFGWYASFLAYIIGIGALKGYQYFNGRLGPFTRIIIVLSSIVAFVFAELMTVVIKLSAHKLPISVESLNILYTNPEIKETINFNMTIGLLFATLGTYQLLKILKNAGFTNIQK